MLNTASLFRIFNELLLVLLGVLLILLTATGRYLIPHRSPAWMGLGAFLVYWGLRAWLRPGPRATGWQDRLRGGSLALVGIVMPAIAWARLPRAAIPLGSAGGILVLRGLLGAVLAARAS
jgi:hypothetical protein